MYPLIDRGIENIYVYGKKEVSMIMKGKLIGFLKVTCSGIGGVLLTLIVQSIFQKSPSFTFVYNGDEVVVTESSYESLMEDNEKLEGMVSSLEKQVAELQGKMDDEAFRKNIEDTIKVATDYWNNGEYIQALSALKNSNIDAESIKALYQNYSENYSAIVTEQANGMITEKKYDDAKNLLTDAMPIVDDTSTLKEKLSEINSNMPIELSNLKISASRYFELIEDKAVEDSIGNRYTLGNIFSTRAEGDTGYGYATFYLGQKYSGLTGVIAVSDESENRADVQLEGWIEIYSKKGDKYQNLYTSPILSRAISPVDVPEIDLSDAEWLEIRYYNNGDYFSIAGGYHSLRVLLSDFMLYSY